MVDNKLLLGITGSSINRMKEIKSLQHNFGTKLTIMTGYLSLLKDGSYGEVSPEVLEILAIIQDSSKELVDLANKIFIYIP